MLQAPHVSPSPRRGEMDQGRHFVLMETNPSSFLALLSSPTTFYSRQSQLPVVIFFCCWWEMRMRRENPLPVPLHFLCKFNYLPLQTDYVYLHVDHDQSTDSIHARKKRKRRKVYNFKKYETKQRRTTVIHSSGLLGFPSLHNYMLEYYVTKHKTRRFIQAWVH
jgi:hypothetical protein